MYIENEGSLYPIGTIYLKENIRSHIADYGKHFELVEEPEFKVEAVYRVIKDTEWLKVGDIVRTVIVDLEDNTIKVQGGKSSYEEWFNIYANERKAVSRDLKNCLERIEENKFKVGDKLRVIERAYGCSVGRVIEIKKVDLEERFFIDTASRKWYFTEVKDYPNELGLTIYLERIEEKQEELKVNKFEELFKEVGKETVKNTIFGKLTKVKDGIDFEDWVAENIDISKIPHNLSYDEVLDTYKCYLSDAYREGRRVWYQKQVAREKAEQDRAEFKRLSKKLGKCNS